MSSPDAVYKPDCSLWKGYKPCDYQQVSAQPNCGGCPVYEPSSIGTPEIADPYDPEALRQARSIGVIEMGGLGSILRTTAVTKALQTQNKEAEITWYTHRLGAELLQYVPGVTAVNIQDTDPSEYEENISSLDILMNFELADAAGPIVAKSRKVGGFLLNGQGNFYGAAPHAQYLQRLQIDDAFRSDNDLTMQEILLRTAGLPESPAEYDVQLYPENIIGADTILKQAFQGRTYDSYIGLNIGTSEKGKLKRWPAGRFAQLAQRLAVTNPGTGVALLNGPEDAAPRTKIMESLSDNVENIALTPRDMEAGDFMAVVSRMGVMVTGDTFAMHAAKAFGVPTVTLAGPMPHKELELQLGDTLIGPKLACSPCFGKCVRTAVGQCMELISVDEVYQAVAANIDKPLLPLVPAPRKPVLSGSVI